ncbi:MAG: DUF2339 domain-containing protein [Deltaproteobacteria bacterium]|nr:MAG: DUF2339 domain-containing protein [Deltaproteobacteria bacterium]
MLGLVCVVALVLAVVAIARTATGGSLAERIAALEREVQQLRALLRAREAAPDHAEKREPARAPVAAPETVPPQAAAPPFRERPAAPPPPPAGAPRPAVPPPVSAPRVEIDWEQLFGVRAAAGLGGVALALAGLLFFKYSIEHGLIPPWLRVVLGTVVGVASIAGSEWTLRRRYARTADALAGAGMVVLYAAFWAASIRYSLVPIPVAFVLMVAVTASGCILSWRHGSQVIASLGLVGGFLTPLLLSTGADRPIGLFGYVLLLDTGLLYLARQRRWPVLALLSLAGTVFYQALWIGTRMGPDRLLLGLAILGAFALLFAVAPRLAGGEETDLEWLIAQAGGVLVPFAFVLYFASRTRLGLHFHPYGILLVPLSAAAGWITRVQRTYRIGLGAAAATVAILGAWLFTRAVGAGLAWEAALWCVVLALTFHVFVEWEHEPGGVGSPAPAAIFASLGFFVLLIVGSASTSLAQPWPWLAGSAGLAVLLIRHATFPSREFLHLVAAFGMGVALAEVESVHGRQLGFPPPWVYFAVLLGAALAFQVVALARRAPEARRMAEYGAAGLAALLLLARVPVPGAPLPPLWLFHGTTLALGVLVALSATRLCSGPGVLGAALATAFVQWGWTGALRGPGETTPLLLQGAAVLLFTAWPFLAGARFRADRFAWYGAALAAPAWFLSLRRLYLFRFGAGTIGLLPVVLALVSLAAAVRARERWAESDPIRVGVIAWFGAVAMGFVTVAIPLQLEKEWITIGWALEGLAVTALWVRLDYPGLKYFGLALLWAVTVRLVANPAVLGYYPRPAFRIVNWLLYTYLVPAVALLGTAALLRPRELARARGWERERLYVHGMPAGALGAGFAALVVIFVWINLAIADWFATGPMLHVSFERMAGRDLTTSLAWAVYALVLLAIGMSRRSIGLRWVSLGLFMITIAKVFLHDLGQLHDLYRVASLLGLALALIAVSLAYQRFVFRGPSAEGT